jgi:hypothetical protein
MHGRCKASTGQENVLLYWLDRPGFSGVFNELSMPGAMLRVMDKCVHRSAIESAGKKLRQLSPGRKALS